MDENTFLWKVVTIRQSTVGFVFVTRAVSSPSVRFKMVLFLLQIPPNARLSNLNVDQINNLISAKHRIYFPFNASVAVCAI